MRERGDSEPLSLIAHPSASSACHSRVPHETRLRVRYAHTDAMGVVYYANYLAFFEAARVELLRDLGLSYREFEERGTVAAVVEATCRYRAPARFDDLLIVRTRLVDLRRATFAFEYEIVREGDGILIASGRTAHACLDRQSLRPVALPQDARDMLARWAEPGPALAE